MKNGKLKIVYSEVLNARKQQQLNIDLIYNKLNWIIVSNVLFLIFSLGLGFKNRFIIISVFLFFTSLCVSLYNTMVRKFKMGPLLKEVVGFGGNSDVSEERFLKDLCKKIAESINKNEDIIKKLSSGMKLSIYSLICGIFILIISLL